MWGKGIYLLGFNFFGVSFVEGEEEAIELKLRVGQW